MSRTQRAESAELHTEHIQRLDWRRANAAPRPRRVEYRLRAKRQRPPETFQAPPSRLQGSELDAVFVSPTPRGQQVQQVSGEYLPAAAGLAYAGIVKERYQHSMHLRAPVGGFAGTAAGQLRASPAVKPSCGPVPTATTEQAGKGFSRSVHDLTLWPWHAPASIWLWRHSPNGSCASQHLGASAEDQSRQEMIQLAARQDGYRLSAGLPDPWPVACSTRSPLFSCSGSLRLLGLGQQDRPLARTSKAPLQPSNLAATRVAS
jgi:hypothetical protein